MNRQHSGFEKVPLSTGTTDNPSLTQGSETTFRLGGVDYLDGKNPRYTPGLHLSISGNVVQSGGTGTRFSVFDLYRCLMTYLEIRGAFFGTPLRSSKFLGAYIPSIEFVANGYQYSMPKRSFFPAANGTYAFVLDVFVPVNYFGCNVDPAHTAQLVAALKDATFAIGVAGSAVISGLSTGASLTSLTARCSMLVFPDPEIRVAPGIEWTDYIAPFSSGAQIDFQNLGDDTGFDGVEGGAGMLAMYLLTSAAGQSGAFAGNNVTAFGVPWRSQRRSVHLEPFITDAWAAMDAAGVVGSVQDAGTASGLSDFSRAPHLYIPGADPTGSALVNTSLKAIPVISPGHAMQLSKAQFVRGNLPILFEASSGSGSHHLLTCQAKRWTRPKLDSYTQMLFDLGIPQARGLNSPGAAQWQVKMADHQSAVNPRKARFLPLKLAAR